MGNWNITIEGVGPHNNQSSYDTEAHAARLVRGLTEDQHNVTHAMVHAGGGRVEFTIERAPGVAGVVRSDGGEVTPIFFDPRDRAAHFYDVYCKSSGGKNFRGDPCPAWADLPEAIQRHWTAVARAAGR